MRPYVSLIVHTTIDTTKWEFGENFLTKLSAIAPEFVPEFIASGTETEMRRATKFSDIVSCREYWAKLRHTTVNNHSFSYNQDFLWRRKRKICHRCEIKHRQIRYDNSIADGNIIITAKWDEKYDWYKLFLFLIEIFEAEDGLLHYYNKSELENHELRGGFKLGINEKLDPHLDMPNYGWATMYNPEYAKGIDQKEIRDNGFDVTEVVNGFVVKLTNSIDDLENHYEFFNQKRNEFGMLMNKAKRP